MSESVEFANPFATLADLMRGLRQDILEEAGAIGDAAVPVKPHLGPILGAIAAMTTRCERLRREIDGLAHTDPESYAVVQRALGRPPLVS